MPLYGLIFSRNTIILLYCNSKNTLVLIACSALICKKGAHAYGVCPEPGSDNERTEMDDGGACAVCYVSRTLTYELCTYGCADASYCEPGGHFEGDCSPRCFEKRGRIGTGQKLQYYCLCNSDRCNQVACMFDFGRCNINLLEASDIRHMTFSRLTFYGCFTVFSLYRLYVQSKNFCSLHILSLLYVLLYVRFVQDWTE